MAFGINDTVQQVFDLLLSGFELTLPLRPLRLSLTKPHVPRVAEHRLGNREELWRWLERFQDVSEARFYLRTRH
ncbi:hypothetical protein [Roseovarius sp. D22-M7]|uniref:hypothetical protein n=1 Tax=Roseovarius sp. D22-M7 TaxID=3127116 RepID=UPI00301005F4